MPDNNPDLISSPIEDAGSCLRTLEPRIRELADKLAVVRLLPDDPTLREEAECNLCLASRSAYFMFYTWVVIHSEVDEQVEQTLDRLFAESVHLLRSETYKGSVAQRYEDFKSVCENLAGEGLIDSVSSASLTPAS